MSRKGAIPFVLLCLVGFWVDFATMVGMVAVPFLILEHVPSGNTALSGKVFAVQMATYTIVCLLMARIVGKSKKILIWPRWGVIIFAFSYSLYPFFPYKMTLYLFSIISFFAMAISWPAFYAWVGTETDEHKRQRNLAFFNISWSLGFTLGPLFAGPLYDLDYRAPYILIFLINIFAFILLLFIRDKEQHFDLDKNLLQETAVDNSEEKTNELYLYPYWIGVFLANLLSVIPRSTYAEHLKKMVSNGELHLLFEKTVSPILQTNPATKFSWPSAAMAFATASIFLIFAWTYFWKHRISILILSQGICALTFLALSGTKSIILICLSFAMIGANHGITFFASTYYSVHHPELRHRRASINEGLVGLGGVVGSIIFGFLVEEFGVPISYKFVAVIVLIVVFVELLIFNLMKKKIKSLNNNINGLNTKTS